MSKFRAIIIAVLFVLTLPLSLLAQEAGWQIYKPINEELKILMPEDVTADETKFSIIEQYTGHNGGDNFVMVITPAGGEKTLDRYIDAAKSGMRTTGITSFKDLDEMEGKGWTGRKFIAYGKDYSITCMIAIDDTSTEGVQLATSALADDQRTDRFFRSLEIDTDMVKKKKSQFFDKLFTPESISVILGILLLALGFILFLVASIWFLVLAFQTHIGWGFGVLFGLGIGHIAFLAYDFKKSWVPFVIFIVSCLINLVGFLIVMNGSK